MRVTIAAVAAVALALVVMSSAPNAVAQDCLDYAGLPDAPAPVGPQIAPAGGAQAVATVGSVLCLGTSSGIQCYDVSDPLSPTWLGEVPLVTDHLVARGTVLYAAGQYGGLQAIDLGDPTAPVVTAAFALERGAWDLLVSGQYLYVTPEESDDDGLFGLSIYDLTDPTRPVLVDEVQGGAGFYCCLHDDVMYLVNYDPYYANVSYVSAVDLADPAAPVFLNGWVSFDGRARDVAAHGTYLYAATPTHGLQVVDLADPAAPVLGTVLSDLAGAHGVAVVGDVAWVTVHAAEGDDRVYALSLADPAQPQILAWTPFSGGDVDRAAADGWLYLACEQPGPTLIEIDEPAAPTARPWTGLAPGHWDLQGTAVKAVGSRLYVASSVGDPLRVFDLTQPWTPVQLASVSGDGTGRDLAIHDDLLCLVTRDPDPPNVWSLDTYSLADPDGPVLLGGSEMPTYFWHLAATADAAYGFMNGLLHVVDLADPSQPQYVQSINLPGYGVGSPLRVAGGHLYIAAGSGGLQVHDLGAPLAPVLVGELTLEFCGAVDVAGDRAVALDYYRGLLLVDVSDPTAPTVLDEIALPGEGYRVTLDGGTVLVTTAGNLAWVYRIDEAAHLVPAGELVQALGTSNAAVVGPWIALAQATAGVQLVWRDCGLTTVAAPDDVPGTVDLLSVAPNPFNPLTTVSYVVSTAGAVDLGVFDLGGRRLARLHQGWREPGVHAVTWDGRDDHGRALPSATYLVRVRTADGATMRKATLVR